MDIFEFYLTVILSAFSYQESPKVMLSKLPTHSQIALTLFLLFLYTGAVKQSCTSFIHTAQELQES